MRHKGKRSSHQTHVRDVMVSRRWNEEKKLTKVWLQVDWQALFEEAAERAIRNKTGKTRMVGGIIEARAKLVT